jgi:Membrane dipeptidase (Peptidase family M19)
MAADRVPFIDGHNDVLLELQVRGEGPRPFLARRDEGHLDMVRATDGGFAAGFFAVFVLPESEEERAATKIPNRTPPYAQPLAGPIPTGYATREAGVMIDLLDELVAAGGVRRVRSRTSRPPWTAALPPRFFTSRAQSLSTLTSRSSRLSTTAGSARSGSSGHGRTHLRTVRHSASRPRPTLAMD